jgi:uncharacterized membrane protein YfcA
MFSLDAAMMADVSRDLHGPGQLAGDLISAQTAFVIPALVAAGLAAGLMGGLFGIGGGAVLVPVLYQLFIMLGIDEAVRMQLAVGTSLGIIVPTSIRSFFSHKSHGAIDFPYLRRVIIWVIVGVGLGSLAAAFISGRSLRAIFAVLALLMALKMIFGRSEWRLWEEFPPPFILRFLAAGIGFFSVLMGIGGGVFNNILMTLIGRDIHKAVATSSGVGVAIAIPGAFGFMWAGLGHEGLPAASIGFVNLLGVALVIPTSLFAVPYGARLAHSLSRAGLRRAFATFLVFVSARFFISLL